MHCQRVCQRGPGSRSNYGPLFITFHLKLISSAVCRISKWKPHKLNQCLCVTFVHKCWQRSTVWQPQRGTTEGSDATAAATAAVFQQWGGHQRAEVPMPAAKQAGQATWLEMAACEVYNWIFPMQLKVHSLTPTTSARGRTDEQARLPFGDCLPVCLPACLPGI